MNNLQKLRDGEPLGGKSRAEDDFSDMDDDDDDFYDNNSYRSNREMREDTFDALTDGMYGDYDDWLDAGGDMDSLRDGLGF